MVIGRSLSRSRTNIGAAQLTRRCVLSGLADFVCSGQEQATFRIDVDLVRLTFTAGNRDGQPVHDLRVSDLMVQDNGQQREILHLWRDLGAPLAVGLIADVSLTQVAHIAEHRSTILGFLRRVLQPRDRAFIVTAASEVVLVTDLTDSLEDLMLGIGKIDSLQSSGKRLGPECPPKALPPTKDGRPRFVTGCGGSQLWDAIFHSVRLKMKPLSGRKALIFLSDGLDTGSVHSLSDAIEAAQGADALVYTINYRTEDSNSASDNLLRLSRETGGRSFEVSHHGLPKVFDQIEGDLRSIYVLAFRAPSEAADGNFRKLKLATTRKDVILRTRPGYALPVR